MQFLSSHRGINDEHVRAGWIVSHLKAPRRGFDVLHHSIPQLSAHFDCVWCFPANVQLAGKLCSHAQTGHTCAKILVSTRADPGPDSQIIRLDNLPTEIAHPTSGASLNGDIEVPERAASITPRGLAAQPPVAIFRDRIPALDHTSGLHSPSVSSRCNADNRISAAKIHGNYGWTTNPNGRPPGDARLQRFGTDAASEKARSD